MKMWIIASAALAVTLSAYAVSDLSLSKETLEDIAKHETIASAHLEAAKCLRAGKSDEVCEGALLQACKGVAIGKFCGMKH
jgi:hypothetical protein